MDAKQDGWDLQNLAVEAADMVSTYRAITPKMPSQLHLSVLSLSESKNLKVWKSLFWELPLVLSQKVDSSRNRKLIMNVGSWVRSVTFSPDGKRVVSGSDDNSVRIWDAESGEQLRQLDGHGSSVWSVAFSLDGKRVVSGSSDNSVRIWDSESGEQLFDLENAIKSVSFQSPSIFVPLHVQHLHEFYPNARSVPYFCFFSLFAVLPFPQTISGTAPPLRYLPCSPRQHPWTALLCTYVPQALPFIPAKMVGL